MRSEAHEEEAMHRKLAIVALLLLGVCVANASVIADFEDIPLAPESYRNGADTPNQPSGFWSNGLFFPHTYVDDPPYSYWHGVAASNMTDTTTPGYTNQFSAWTGSGYAGSPNYAVATGLSAAPRVELPIPTTVDGLYLTNTTYAALSIRDGDYFNDPFGGPDGTEPDWFTVTITGRDAGGTATGTATFYLADYRFDNNDLDYIVDAWTWVDLSGLGAVSTIEFSWDSSDSGPYGINTPAYVAFDSLSVAQVPEPAALLALLLAAAIRRR
jgi:hypothetical protein